MKRLLLVLLIGLLGVGAVAQEVSSSSSAASVKAARATPVGRTVLPNGLVLLVNEAPAEDMVAVELLVKVGLVDEQTPTAGITNVIQALIEKRVKEDKRLAASGSLFEVSTEPDYARISLLTTSENFPQLLDTLGKAIAQRTFDPAKVEEVTRDAVNNLENPGNAYTQLYGIFRNAFYRYHPYRKSDRGRKLSLERLKPGTLAEFFDRYYVPNRMVLSISGRVDRLAVVESVKASFGALAPGDSHVIEVPWEAKPVEKQVNLSTSADIAWLFIGFPGPSVASRDYIPMTLVHAILGDGLSSRLFNEIREKRGLAYEVGATYPILRGPSHFLTYVITRPNDAGKVRRTLLAEVDRMKTERITITELEAAKRKATGRYLLAHETNRDRALKLAEAETIGLGFQFDQNYLEQLERVTPEDIQRVSTTYLVDPTLIVARPGGRFYLDF
ncbi:MAG: M16 family metallopeptidase [Vulcanimicrobiota bacterium]